MHHVDVILVQRLRRLPNIKLELGQLDDCDGPATKWNWPNGEWLEPQNIDSSLRMTQQTRDVHPMMIRYWPIVIKR